MIGILMVMSVPGYEKSVYTALKGLAAIKEVHHAFGEFDFLVMVVAEGMDSLHDVMRCIGEIGNVAAAQVLVAGETVSEVPVP